MLIPEPVDKTEDYSVISLVDSPRSRLIGCRLKAFRKSISPEQPPLTVFSLNNLLL